MMELTFQVTQDGTFAAEAGEVYAGEEKRTVEGDAVSLGIQPLPGHRESLGQRGNSEGLPRRLVPGRHRDEICP